MKKLGILTGTVLVLGLLGYLFLYPGDYLVRMEVKTFPGAITQSIKLWDSIMPNAEITEQNSPLELTQEFVFGDSIHQYQWKIIPVHDSLSKIRVFAQDKDHSLLNKLMVPFTNTEFEQRTERTLMDFLDNLDEHIKSFRVNIVGEAEFPGNFCACTELKTKQLRKANGMMRDYPLLSSVLVNNGLELDGPPIIEITKWDRENDLLEFNFCFPIVQQEALPVINEIRYLEVGAKKALKAVYNGNYITSDRAWYALMDYGEKNNYNLLPLPIEVFYSNPNLSGDTMKWKAEIYMPLQDAR